MLCALAANSSLTLAEQITESPTSVRLSSRLASEIRLSLPKYEPPAGNAASSSAPAVPNSDLLVLPKVVVRENAQRRIIPNELLKAQALDKKLAREFKNSLEGLDAVLNGFSIPLISPSMASRGRAAYKAHRMEDLANFIGATKSADSASAAEMNKAVIEMNKAEDWQNRVTGDK